MERHRTGEGKERDNTEEELIGREGEMWEGKRVLEGKGHHAGENREVLVAWK